MTLVVNEIYSLLNVIISHNYTNSDINRLVKIAQNFALSRLWQLVKIGRIKTNTFQISLNHVALDCIAEIFRQDSSGRFSEIEDYFKNETDISRLTEKLAHQHFRILVFRKLQDGLFRLHSENDPIFSKIIRNIKLHLRNETKIHKFEMFEEVYIFSCSEENLNKTKTEYPIEEIESLLSLRTNYHTNIKEFLFEILEILNEQTENRKFISITDAAGIIKRIMLKRMSVSDEEYNLGEKIENDEISTVVSRCIFNTKKAMLLKFAEKVSIPKEYFERSFTAIEEILFNTFLETDGLPESYIKYLQKYIPELSAEDYRLNYHHQFEYIIKCAKKDVIEQLKEYL